MTADQLLTAIEAGDLETVGVDGMIQILIDGVTVKAVRCQPGTRPRATVGFDGRTVDVFSSLGSSDTISISCDSPQDATVITKALDVCFEVSYRDLMEEQR